MFNVFHEEYAIVTGCISSSIFIYSSPSVYFCIFKIKLSGLASSVIFNDIFKNFKNDSSRSSLGVIFTLFNSISSYLFNVFVLANSSIDRILFSISFFFVASIFFITSVISV